MKTFKFLETTENIKILDKYIFKQLMETFLLGIAIFTSIMFASNTFLTLVKQVTVLGIPIPYALMIIILKLPMIISMTIPMGVLLSVVMTVSNLSSNQEINVLKACGISLWRIARPLILFSIISAILCFILTEFISPAASRQAKILTVWSIGQKNIPNNVKNYSMKETDKGGLLKRLLYVDSSKKKSLSGIIILNRVKNNMFQIIIAKHGRPGKKALELNDVATYTISEDGKILNTSICGSFELASNLSAEAVLDRHKEQEFSFRKLKKYIEEYKLKKQQEEALEEKETKNYISKLTIYLYDKITMPLTSIVLAIIAIPLSITPPRSKFNRGILFSIIILFFYYLIRAIATALGESGVILPIVASWLPVLIIGIIGGIMLYRKVRLV